MLFTQKVTFLFSFIEKNTQNGGPNGCRIIGATTTFFNFEILLTVSAMII